MKTVQASAATSEYVNFLLETTESQAKAVNGKISLICAAMVPCMRLYAFLGQSLAASGFGRSIHDNEDTGIASPLTCPKREYSEWVETYAAAEFEDLTSSLEALLDRYAAEEAAPAEPLATAYARAMQMELAFFSAQPGTGADTAPSLMPRLVAVDFDQTITEEDTSKLIVQASTISKYLPESHEVCIEGREGLKSSHA